MNPNQLDQRLRETIRKDRKFSDQVAQAPPRYRTPNSETFDRQREPFLAVQLSQAAAGVFIHTILIVMAMQCDIDIVLK